MTERILLVHRYFWPDVPTYAQMLRLIGAHLGQQGHEVSVFCGPASYNGVYDGPRRPRTEFIDGMLVHRVKLPPDRKNKPLVRAASLVVFAARLIAHVVRHRADYDLITITTIPPVVMGVAARVIKRLTGIRYLYHCMDLYPEVGVLAGIARSPMFVRLAKHIDSANCRMAVAVVVLSTDMRSTLAERGLDTRNVVVLNNFQIEEYGQQDAARAIPKLPGVYRVLFAGNIGRFQGLESIVAAAHALSDELPTLEFVFVGAGSCVQALREQAGGLLGNSVKFVDHVPVAVASRVMEDSDIGLVSLRPGIYRVAYPSKTAMYLRAGCRILAVVEKESELARMVLADNVGTSCEPGDVPGLTRLIRAEVARGAPTSADRARSRAAGERYFGRNEALHRWSTLLGEIEAGVD